MFKALAQNNKSFFVKSKMAHSVLFALLFFLLVPANAQNRFFSRDSIKDKHIWYAAQLLPGSVQVINKQYWKVPVFWAGMGTFAYLGYNANSEYKRLQRGFDPVYYGPEEIAIKTERWELQRMERNLYYTGAAFCYMASVADALLVYTKGRQSPTTATVFSTFVPGLGQIYNQKYWKVPIIYGGFASLYFVFDFNNRNYTRLRTAYNYRTDNDESTVDTDLVNLSDEAIAYYMDSYRRTRDLTVIGMFVLYAANIIDANVDANLYDWDISDNLALRFEPTLNGDVLARGYSSVPTVGFKCKLNF